MCRGLLARPEKHAESIAKYNGVAITEYELPPLFPKYELPILRRTRRWTRAPPESGVNGRLRAGCRSPVRLMRARPAGARALARCRHLACETAEVQAGTIQPQTAKRSVTVRQHSSYPQLPFD